MASPLGPVPFKLSGAGLKRDPSPGTAARSALVAHRMKRAKHAQATPKPRHVARNVQQLRGQVSSLTQETTGLKAKVQDLSDALASQLARTERLSNELAKLTVEAATDRQSMQDHAKAVALEREQVMQRLSELDLREQGSASGAGGASRALLGCCSLLLACQGHPSDSDCASRYVADAASPLLCLVLQTD